MHQEEARLEMAHMGRLREKSSSIVGSGLTLERARAVFRKAAAGLDNLVMSIR